MLPTQNMTYQQKYDLAARMLAKQGYSESEIEKILETTFIADKEREEDADNSRT